MKLHKQTILVAVSLLLCFAGLFILADEYFYGPDERHDIPFSERYAELRLGNGAEFEVLICRDRWLGLFSHAGFAQYRHVEIYRMILQGDGPQYIDPKLQPPDPWVSDYTGTITVDKLLMKVVIDLHHATSTLEHSQEYEQCYLNGTYPIKLITHNEFE